jgi:DNA-directed RNA polymerase sigma subunit (sigma70/sigma32)
VLEDKRGADPVREIQRKDLKELITKGLSRAERLIIILYYFEEMTMKEIGATLDLSESRVSQMHSSILARLKAQMADRRTKPVQILIGTRQFLYRIIQPGHQSQAPGNQQIRQP